MSRYPIDVNNPEYSYNLKKALINIRKWLDEHESYIGSTTATDLTNYATTSDVVDLSNIVDSVISDVRRLEELDASTNAETYVTVDDESSSLPNSIQYNTIKIDNLAAAEDNTDLNATTSAHGLCPKGSASATQYLNGNLGWTTPAGGTSFDTAVVAKLSGNQSIPDNTATLVALATEDLDNDEEYNNATYRFVPKADGWYRIYGGARFTAHATGFRYVGFALGGVTATMYGRNSQNSVGGATVTTITTISPIYITTTDYLEMYVFQNSGGALNLEQSVQTYMAIERIL